MELLECMKMAIQKTEAGETLNVEIEIPKDMTCELYLKIFIRISSLIRRQLYKRIREINTHMPPQEKGIKEALETVSSSHIAERICKKYEVIKSEDDDYTLLLERVYYVHLKDRKFCEESDKEKLKNQKLIEAIFAGVEIPEMDKDLILLTDLQLFVFVHITS